MASTSQIPISNENIVDRIASDTLATAIKNQYGLNLIQQIVDENRDLPNIVSSVDDGLPVYLASENELKDVTEYLYQVTGMDYMNSMNEKTMSSFLWNLIKMNLFGIASELVQRLPDQLERCPYNTITALARKFHGSGNNILEARAFLRSVWGRRPRLSTSYSEWFDDYTCKIIIENAESGSTVFVEELFRIEPEIMRTKECRITLLSHAIKNREKDVFNLVYTHVQPRDLHGFSDEDRHKILRSAAELPPSIFVPNRKLGAALQMQSELQWFNAVWNLSDPKYRDARNSEGYTPHELFIEKHKYIKQDGERSMKEIAQSCTVVGALIVTMMFGAAFTVPDDETETTLTKILVRVYIICDAIALYSSTTSVLTCLGILMARYSEDDFLVNLPRKLMIALSTLFISIATMMITFCSALVIILDAKLSLFLPVVVLALVPIGIYLWSILSLLYDTYVSTYRPTNLWKKPEDKKAKLKPPRIDTNRVEDMV